MEERKRIFYGWIITASAWLIYFLTAGPPAYGTAVITTRMVTQYGWSESVVSTVPSLRSFSYAMTALFGGFLIKRFGVKKCIVAGDCISISCMLCIYLFDLSETAYALMFLGIGVGYGMIIVGGPAIVTGWFSRNKSLPMSILLTAGSVGGMVMPIISEFLCQRSVRLCWAVYIGFFLLSVLIALFVVKNKPEDIGEIPDGREWTAAHPLPEDPASASGAAQHAEPVYASMKEVFRSRYFYLLGLIMLTAHMTFTCFNSYIILYSVQGGIDSVMAAAILSAYSVSNFVSRMMCGAFDRLHLPKYRFVVLTLVGKVVSFLILAFLHSAGWYMAASLLFGFAAGLSTPLVPMLVSTIFGPAMFSRLYGIYNAVASLGSTVTPLIVVAIRKVSGGFEAAYFSFAVFMGAVMVLAIVFRPAKTE